MSKVYVIERYDVAATVLISIHSTKEKAEAALAYYNQSDMGMDEYELDCDPIKEDLGRWVFNTRLLKYLVKSPNFKLDLDAHIGWVYNAMTVYMIACRQTPNLIMTKTKEECIEQVTKLVSEYNDKQN